MEISSCTPWQYCRTYGLDVPTSSTGMRRAAGGRQPAAAKPPYTHIYYASASERAPFSFTRITSSEKNAVLSCLCPLYVWDYFL